MTDQDMKSVVEGEERGEESVLTIGEIAQICRISRQALIYYDRAGIFKPMYTDKNGYRVYSIYQVPFLREICALKEKDLYLKDIAQDLSDRKVQSVVDLLVLHRTHLDEQIESLQKKRTGISDRILYYQNAKMELSNQNRPYIKLLPERKLLFQAWGTEDMNRTRMHMTHMNLRNLARDMDISVDFGWGAMLRYDDIKAGRPLRGGGAYVPLPDDFDTKRDTPRAECLVVPAGKFVCMNVYCMPYDTSPLDGLYRWIAEHDYTVIGDLISECVLDTTFYTKERQCDFCQLQVLIETSG